MCFNRFFFSGRGRVTSCGGEFGEILFKHRQVRCKKKHILPPQAATSSVFIRRRSASYGGTSRTRIRLHFITPRQAVDLPPALKLRRDKPGPHARAKPAASRSAAGTRQPTHSRRRAIGWFSSQSVRSTRFRRISFLNREVTLSGQKKSGKAVSPSGILAKNGVGEGTRTLDLLGHNQAL